MSDLISRQAAIDRIRGTGYADQIKENVIMILMGLPPAQPTIEEHKTGKWIEIHGFCTPGGDPVWACSECGKGIHVYGIEHGTYGSDVSDGQWKACPNCGADMREVNNESN